MDVNVLKLAVLLVIIQNPFGHFKSCTDKGTATFSRMTLWREAFLKSVHKLKGALDKLRHILRSIALLSAVFLNVVMTVKKNTTTTLKSFAQAGIDPGTSMFLIYFQLLYPWAAWLPNNTYFLESSIYYFGINLFLLFHFSLSQLDSKYRM